MILQKTVLRALVGAACLAPASGQIVLRESLTDRAVWKHAGGATTVTGSSRFGKVDRLTSAAQFSYVRQTITLQPGSYRVRVRFQKTHGLAQDPLRLEVRAAATVLGQSTVAVGKARIGRWEHTPSATFLLTKPTAVIVTLAGGSPFRLDRRWMFDQVELERTHFNGDSALDTLGTSSSGAGDVNGDGFADVVVGAPWDDHSAADSGSARVLSGKDGRVLYVFHGDSAGDGLGWSVSGAGDVNGDGVVDVIVGAPGDDNNGSLSGSARVFSGKDGKALYTLNGDGAGDQFGQSVSGAGDVNGDGFADVVVGARNDDNNAANSGSARVFSGKDGKILYTFNGDRADDGFGTSVSGAGDVNGDGFADVIVGAPGNDSNGRASGSARVFSGKDGTVLHRFSGASTFDELGKSVSSAGDVNRDGFADLIVGAPGYGSTGAGAGFARVFSGQNGKVLFTFHGDHALDRFGWSVSGAEDVNGDGFADLIVGAVSDDNSGRDSGSARVFSGKSGKVLRTYIGESAFDRFGLSVGGAGDVNGDGLADLVVGANNDDNTGVNSGSVRVILSEVEVYRPGATFQDWIVSDVGDVNRDGHADVIVGDSRNSWGELG